MVGPSPLVCFTAYVKRFAMIIPCFLGYKPIRLQFVEHKGLAVTAARLFSSLVAPIRTKNSIAPNKLPGKSSRIVRQQFCSGQPFDCFVALASFLRFSIPAKRTKSLRRLVRFGLVCYFTCSVSQDFQRITVWEES
eukprot:GHVT01043223.1.p1 GENE.GHVT01043223.1~~GHVT01043223.1.p1  ORF type:complete len:136 (+),score=0.58 GHVT01043223.1:1505-1912(+)